MQSNSDKAMEWIAESDFICRINPNNPPAEFENGQDRVACFKSYCAMQANAAERDGFTLIAETIRLHAAI